ncbi:MAG: hypothetical protein IT210_07950 [Armatimonadetes bacterium]|nr:hypothetical protein [Armatimonadota bacterium]
MRISLLDKLAFAISAVFSPFLVPFFFIVGIVAMYTHDLRQLALWSGITLFFSTGVPALDVLYRYYTGRVSDIHVMYREQRTEPFVVGIVSAALGAGTLYAIDAPFALVQVGLCMVANGIVFLAVNRHWKISMHMGTLTAAIVSVLFLFGVQMLWLTVLVPPVMWARLHRGKHTVLQLLAGLVVSGIVTAVVFVIVPGQL